MIACINYSLGLNQHQGGGLGQMVEIVIIWPAFPSLNYGHGFISNITHGSQLKSPPRGFTKRVPFFCCVLCSFCSRLHFETCGRQNSMLPTGSWVSRDTFIGLPGAELSSSLWEIMHGWLDLQVNLTFCCPYITTQLPKLIWQLCW